MKICKAQILPRVQRFEIFFDAPFARIPQHNSKPIANAFPHPLDTQINSSIWESTNNQFVNVDCRDSVFQLLTSSSSSSTTKNHEIQDAIMTEYRISERRCINADTYCRPVITRQRRRSAPSSFPVASIHEMMEKVKTRAFRACVMSRDEKFPQ